MIDVSLSTLRFALPTVVEAKGDSSFELHARTELPQEFFGLPASNQLSVINGLAGCFAKYLSELKIVSEQIDESLNGIALPIGVSVLLRKKDSFEVEYEINFPNSWISIGEPIKEKALRALQYLMYSIGLSIVNREETYGC